MATPLAIHEQYDYSRNVYDGQGFQEITAGKAVQSVAIGSRIRRDSSNRLAVGTRRGGNSPHSPTGAFSIETKKRKGGLNMAAVYKVGKKWRADWIDNKGVRHRRRFKTKGDADDFLTGIEPELKAGTWVAPKDIPTFGVLADRWLKERIEISRTPGSGYRPSTLLQWQSHVAHLKFSFENWKADAIRPGAFAKAMAVWRLLKVNGGRGLGGKTCGKIRTTASRIFRYAMANQLGVKIDPTKLMEPEKVSSGEQVIAGEQVTGKPLPGSSKSKSLHKVTEQEVLAPKETKALILATTPGLYRTLIMTALYIGARISELLALKWSDVDLDKRVITIRRSLSTARVKGELNQEKWRWFSPKTTAGERKVPFSPELATALREWREKCPESRFDLIFCNEAGEPLDRTAIGRSVLAPALKQAQIEKKITLHRLRHTYASTLIMLGRDVAQVSKYLGHSDVYVTLTVYTHFVQRKNDTMDDFEQLMQMS